MKKLLIVLLVLVFVFVYLLLKSEKVSDKVSGFFSRSSCSPYCYIIKKNSDVNNLPSINGNAKFKIITGSDRKKDIGLLVDIKTNVYIENLTIEKVFVGLKKRGNGQLTIGTLKIRDFGGDSINIHDSNVRINNLIVRENKPTRPPSYHVDIGFQASCEETLTATEKNSCDLAYNDSVKRKNKFSNPNFERNSYSIKQTTSSLLLELNDKASILNVKIKGSEQDKKEKIRTFLCTKILKDSSNSCKDDDQIKEPREKYYIPFSDKKKQSNCLELEENEKCIFLSTGKLSHLEFNKNHITCAKAFKGCHIKNIKIPSVDIITEQEDSQIFMLSELNKYSDIHIGTKKLHITHKYPYILSANTLENSIIGNLNDVCISNIEPTKCDNPRPQIRISGGNFKSGNVTKYSTFETTAVNILGLGKNENHILPRAGVNVAP